MRNTEPIRVEQYRILLDGKLLNPPDDEVEYRFQIIKEKLTDTLLHWDTLSNEQKAFTIKQAATKPFRKWFEDMFGRVDKPSDNRSDRPRATLLYIKDIRDPDGKKEFTLKYDGIKGDDSKECYLIYPIISDTDFDDSQPILLSSVIFVNSAITTIHKKQKLPPDGRNWIDVV